MDYEWNEIAAIGLFYAVACVPALMVFGRRRDPFDPRVFFPVFYAYVTTGPCLFKIFNAGSYHPGLKVDLLVPVLLSCATASVGFVVGSTLALGRIAANRLDDALLDSVAAQRDRASSRLVRDVAILAAFASIAAYGYFSYQLQAQHFQSAGGGKSFVIAHADEGTLRSFYFFAAAATASLTLAVIADAYASRQAFSPTIVALLLAEFAACTYSGERDVLLVGGVWCVANWRKLSRGQVAIIAALLVAWLGISPVLRAVGLGFGDQLAAVEYFTMEDWFYSVTHFAPNLHVFTNVAAEVPAVDDYWHGSSILGAIASFLPGDFALKEMTPTRWFRDVYDMQRVAGYAFSQDAEAYLNFGWMGPPAWFAVWGYLLSVAYRRAVRPGARLLDVFFWWYAVATSLFAVRSDTRAVFKMFIMGAIATKLLCMAADSWAARKYRGAGRQSLGDRPFGEHRGAPP